MGMILNSKFPTNVCTNNEMYHCIKIFNHNQKNRYLTYVFRNFLNKVSNQVEFKIIVKYNNLYLKLLKMILKKKTRKNRHIPKNLRYFPLYYKKYLKIIIIKLILL